jgi:outer membrane receptor protein involved in Fe transport
MCCSPTSRALAAIAVCVLLCLACFAADGKTLRGQVLDSTGAAIEGAQVKIAFDGGTKEGLTSAGGRFFFDNIAPPATVTVSRKGFADATSTWAGNADLRLALPLAPVQQQVVVTATRTEVALGDVAASISTIDASALASAPELSLDDLLRVVPGFSLFRRSGSRTANPTSQGVSLRGLGASGASRALVIFDGVPLNDPFGGWVYWDRVPTAAVGQVEVVRGGASALYGSGALAGVINLEERKLLGPALTVDSSIGTQGTDSASAVASEQFGRWGITVGGQGLQTDGYIPIAESQRGAADARANERYGTGRLTVDRRFDWGSAFISADLFNESRQNGTVLQFNNTRLAEAIAGLNVALGGGNLMARGFGSAQRFNQSFSSVSADRNSETLVRVQAVPAQQEGVSAQWVRPLTNYNVLAIGGDFRQVRGLSDEVVWTRGAPSSHVIAGGQQLVAGGFVEDMLRIGSSVHVTGALRFDSWQNYDALSATTALMVPFTQKQVLFLDRSATSVSPSLGAVAQVSRLISITGSAYRSFRAPTLNELYRTFRLGNVLTQANDALLAERLWGAEAGVIAGSGPVFARATFFWNTIDDAVGNRTLAITPALITRQRQNIGSLNAHGIELETQARLPMRMWLRLGYQFVDSTVAQSLDAALVGLLIPQVPRHSTSVAFGYQGRHWSGSAVGRYVGRQFDDDLNQFPLSGYFTADASLHYRIRERAEAYIAAENLLDRGYAIARTPIEQLGAPRLVRVGVKVSLPGMGSH